MPWVVQNYLLLGISGTPVILISMYYTWEVESLENFGPVGNNLKTI